MADDEYFYDADLAEAWVSFFPTYLKLTLGEWQGRAFHLAENQKHHTRQIFGWRRRRDGTRRYRKVRGWVPKKNGKTEWLAGIGHGLTVFDGELGAEVYCYASNKGQASVLFNRALNMVALDHDRHRNPGPLAQLYDRITAESMFCSQTMSVFNMRSGNVEGQHGPAASAALGDEAHEWRNGKLHRFLTAGMANRRQPLDVIISTAGRIRTYAHELYEDSKAILADPSLDPECYVFCYEADPEDDWENPKVWAKANPNFGISPKADFIAGLCRDAVRKPAEQNDFLRYHLGIWTEQATRWFSMRDWPKNTAAPNDPDAWKKLERRLIGRECWGGLDLASTSDLTACVWWFPPRDKNERGVLLPRFWCPRAAIEEKDSPRTPYKRWRDIGALIETPGRVTDYDFIEHQVIKDAEKFRVRRSGKDRLGNEQWSLALDRWNATQVGVHLRNEGLSVCMFGQGMRSMAAPSKELERLYDDHALEHGNHPVLKWNFGNVAFKSDAAGNKKPDKEESAGKIDGVTGSVMAIGIERAAAPAQAADALAQKLATGAPVF